MLVGMELSELAQCRFYHIRISGQGWCSIPGLFSMFRFQGVQGLRLKGVEGVGSAGCMPESMIRLEKSVVSLPYKQ